MHCLIMCDYDGHEVVKANNVFTNKQIADTFERLDTRTLLLLQQKLL